MPQNCRLWDGPVRLLPCYSPRLTVLLHPGLARLLNPGSTSRLAHLASLFDLAPLLELLDTLLDVLVGTPGERLYER